MKGDPIEMEERTQIKAAVREAYASRITCRQTGGCCGASPNWAAAIGYQEGDLEGVPEGAAANTFACGNPLAHAGLRKGDVVLDIGSGAGLDAILAARRVGPAGRVIGLDMTPEMIDRARENARQAGLDNIEFRLGDAEDMPVENGSVDWVISNCVINLAPDKDRVFAEVARVLRPGGRVMVSDMVAENLPEFARTRSWAACIGGAIPEQEYLGAMERAGLVGIKVVDRVEYDHDGIKEMIAPFLPGDLDGLYDLVSAGMSALNIKVASIKVYAEKP